MKREGPEPDQCSLLSLCDQDWRWKTWIRGSVEDLCNTKPGARKQRSWEVRPSQWDTDNKWLAQWHSNSGTTSKAVEIPPNVPHHVKKYNPCRFRKEIRTGGDWGKRGKSIPWLAWTDSTNNCKYTTPSSHSVLKFIISSYFSPLTLVQSSLTQGQPMGNKSWHAWLLSLLNDINDKHLLYHMTHIFSAFTLTLSIQ